MMQQKKETIITADRCNDVLEVLPQTPTVLHVRKCITTRGFSGIWDGSLPPPQIGSDTFGFDYFASNLLKKYPFLGADQEKAAISSFEEFERSCLESNRRIYHSCKYNLLAAKDISSIARKIRVVLGDVFDWDIAEAGFSHGPGASTRLRRRESDAYFKFRGKPETTQYNMPLAVAAVGRIPLWFGEIHPLRQTDMFHVVPGCRITTVPKNAKTDRTIGIEPCMNMYVQKGIGSMIRSRLRRVGVNLSDQSHNQNLARLSSFLGLSTLDLKGASDTVCYELVERVLPPAWFEAMKRCRSPRYVLNSRVHTFEKFSTMGNGFTFELESLIFWAIVQVCVDKTFGSLREGRTVSDTMAADRLTAVYGDDIIVPRACADAVVELLNFCGFTVNLEKSNLDGIFHESCGKHYHGDTDVTPVYVDEPVSNPDKARLFANNIARWSARMSKTCPSPVYSAMWARAYKHCEQWHETLAPIPDGVGDDGIVYPCFDGFQVLPVRTARVPLDHSHGKKHKWSGESKIPVLDMGQPMRMKEDYQHGWYYWTWKQVELDLSSRNPQDIPFLLRQLNTVKDTDTFVSDLLSKKGLRRSPGKNILKACERKWVKGWTNSWEPLCVNSCA